VAIDIRQQAVIDGNSIFARQLRVFKGVGGGCRAKPEDGFIARIVINGSQNNCMRTPFHKVCADVLIGHQLIASLCK
jgi:hypothetical protein